MVHLHGWQVGAGFWEVSVPLHSGAYTELLVWCLHDMMTGIFQREQPKRARQKWHLTASPWKSHTLPLQCSNHPDLPHSVWEGTAQKGGSLGAILEVDYQSSSLSYFIPHMPSVHSPSKNYISYIVTYLHLYCL